RFLFIHFLLPSAVSPAPFCCGSRSEKPHPGIVTPHTVLYNYFNFLLHLLYMGETTLFLHKTDIFVFLHTVCAENML
ncbi:MAG: hypothetical protein IJ138_09850, partial [Clostridia bacterium]|nr:hypothetical protein [Clostridia bacterium]